MISSYSVQDVFDSYVPMCFEIVLEKQSSGDLRNSSTFNMTSVEFEPAITNAVQLGIVAGAACVAGRSDGE